jgi:hypothetical protein
MPASRSGIGLRLPASRATYHALLVRGTADVETVEGVSPGYEPCAQRYFGEEQGKEWVEGVRQMSSQMVRITVRPEWVSVLDFETRFPSAIEAAMSGQ